MYSDFLISASTASSHNLRITIILRLSAHENQGVSSQAKHTSRNRVTCDDIEKLGFGSFTPPANSSSLQQSMIERGIEFIVGNQRL